MVSATEALHSACVGISRDHFALLARRVPLPALPTHLESHTQAFLSAAPARFDTGSLSCGCPS